MSMDIYSYVYKKEDLQRIVDDILDGYEDDGLPIAGEVYGRIYHSDMTGMDIAIISENKQYLVDLTDDDFENWLAEGEEAGEDFDWNYLRGLEVLNDESGDFERLNDVVFFDSPLSDIIEESGISTSDEALEYAIAEADEIYYITDEFSDYDGHWFDVVKYSHFRF